MWKKDIRFFASSAQCNHLPPHIRQIALTLIILSALAIAAASHAAGLVFYDGFESGNANLWAQESGRDKCKVVQIAVDGKGPHSGNKMAQCNWNGGVPWSSSSAFSSLRLNSWTYSSEFLIRFWARNDADVDRKAGAKMWRVGDGNTFMGSDFEKVFTMTVSGASGQLNSTFYGTQVFDAMWHKYEFYVKQATTGGVARLWIDRNLLKHTWTGDTRQHAGTWSPMYIMSNWPTSSGSSHDADNHFYWDDIEIYSDTGTGATGLLEDASIASGATSTLNAPSDIRVVP